ncbi:MAG: protein-glutamine gamma-glutamyltransferase [Oscillospiraceae bacterium]|nr:protein-glutamine gamma-glutamyltransferase [Oscillospiraceae bacterium]
MVTNEMYNEFETKLRTAIVDAARALNKSGMKFAVFADTRCNTQYWNRTSNGGWKLASGTDAATAIRDIFDNGYKYATECATAMGIVYYKAISDVYGDELFNRVFTSVYLMDWDVRDPLLRQIGRLRSVTSIIAGDRAYFANLDHAEDLPQWQGENVIVLGDGKYYGHGIGIATADSIINSLNRRRKSDNPRPAYLMDSAARPDFHKLADVMYGGTVAVWRAFPPAVPVMAIPGKRGFIV